MAKRSAGLLLFRRRSDEVEVFLVHPGGPFWANKDLGAWTIPKGEYLEDEDAIHAARREFQEETGFSAPAQLFALGEIRQASGKMVKAWAGEGDCDPARLVSNVCEVEWPPRSRRMVEIPEIDRGAWFTIEQARRRILKSQEPFLDRVLAHLRGAAN
jgi:predicted NUDIX family NTP pyrophosphohydrolase